MTTPEDVQAQLDEALAEIARLKARAERRVTMKVSEKGGLSVYGLGSRFPVTLYPEQWMQLLEMSAEIRGFIEANRAEFKWKETEKGSGSRRA